MSGHTPGPWTIKPSDVDGHFSVESANLIEGDYVAEAYDEADARLIAAAPDLLETMQTIIAALREARDSGVSSVSREDLIAAAATAINKAEGR